VRARRRLLADVVVALGGGALLASSALPWARRGPGHSLHGHALVDAVIALGNTLPGLSAARLTVVWYVVPASGALIWIALGAAGPAHRATRVAAGVAALASTLAFIAFERVLGMSALGSGPFVALAGSCAALVGTTVVPPRRDRRLNPPIILTDVTTTLDANGQRVDRADRAASSG
jgi:hypothetical protein